MGSLRMKNEYVDFLSSKNIPNILFKPLKYRHVQHLLLHLMIVIGMILPPINFNKTPVCVSTHTHTDTHTHIIMCVCVWSERSDQCDMVKVLHVIVNYTIIVHFKRLGSRHIHKEIDIS